MNNPIQLFRTFAWLLLFSFFSCLTTSIYSQSSNAEISLIIDADTANEVDDLFAIVRAVLEPNFKLLGITSAQFHTSPLAGDNSVLESQRMNEEILRLMQRPAIALPLGSNIPISDRSVPAKSEASDFIIKMAHQMPSEQKLHLVILGSCTNVASAILQDPSIIPKIKVYYLGFWHDVTTNTYNKKEFNSGNDPIAVEVLLNTEDLVFSVMTATTSQHLTLKKAEVDKFLKKKGGVADYLVSRWETFHRWWTKEDPQKKSWIMWDLALIEALARPELATTKYFSTPKENMQRPITIYTAIDVFKMKTDFWQSISKIY